MTTAVMKIHLPLSSGQATLSMSYFTDFLSLVLLGPHEAMLVAGASAATQSMTMRRSGISVRQTLFSSATLIITVQAAGLVAIAARRFRPHGQLRRHQQAGSGRRRHVLPLQQLAGRHGRGAVSRPLHQHHLARGLPVGGAGVFRRRGRRDVCRLCHEHAGSVAGPVRGGPAGSHLPQLPCLSRPRVGAPGAPSHRVEPAPGDRRGAGAGHRRPGPDHRPRVGRRRESHPPGRGARGRPWRSRRHDARRDRRPEDRGPAARHRQAGRARAHPDQARPADARGVRLRPPAPDGRRQHPQGGAVPLPGGALHPEPPRAVGWHRAIPMD